MKKKYILFAAIAGVVVILDQVSKGLILSYLPLHNSMEVINGFFSLTHVRNPGAAFGLLAGASSSFRMIFFISITCVAIMVILHSLISNKEANISFTSGLALILAGAVGNLIDRVRLGEVVDFLDLYLGTYHWPTFNVADSAITVGVILLFKEIMLEGKGRNKARQE